MRSILSGACKEGLRTRMAAVHELPLSQSPTCSGSVPGSALRASGSRICLLGGCSGSPLEHRRRFITVDPHGVSRTAGGVSCRPHDLMALGQMLAGGGTANGRQIVSERWIADMQQNGDEDVWARGSQAVFLKTGRYRNNWYQVGGGSNAFLAAGIHGQFLYCDPDTGTVIAVNSSQNEPQNDMTDQKLLGLFAMLSREG